MAYSEQLLDKWKKRLLDVGKRNRLINYRETKRSNIKIISPDIQELYTQLVLKEEQLEFPYSEEYFDELNGLDEQNEDSSTTKGDLLTDRTISEQQKTLRSLRSKAKTAIEEQGVNILYLSFGFLHWKESDVSDRNLISPVILVPVTLTLESINSPFMLSLHEDEIVVNPTLVYKMENDFGIKFPEFDSDEDDIRDYLINLSRLVSKNGWGVSQDIGLSLLSFLKINMYKDLENNQDRIFSNSIVKAWSGDLSGIATLPEEYNNFDHDNMIKPRETFHVVDADSSQQDAILYTKKGVSFVLQGPPGTGKSQTITNIIAEGLADGKKILFVSEKMAALEVVFKRLSQAGLADFCLPLHSHRASKKEVLNELGRTLSLNKIKLQEDALYQLDLLKIEREKLNQYNKELHISCPPLGKSIYDVNGILACRHYAPDVIFSLDGVSETTQERLNNYLYLLNEFSKTIGSMSTDYTENPWRGCHVPNVTHELRHDIETNLRKLIPRIKALSDNAYEAEKELGLEFHLSLVSIHEFIEILEVGAKSPKVPVAWFYKKDITPLFEKARTYKNLKVEYEELQREISQKYSTEYLQLPASQLEMKFASSISRAKELINSSAYITEEEISNSSHSIIDTLKVSIGRLDTIEQIGQIAEKLLGTKIIENMKDAKGLESVLESILSNPKPNIEWFEVEKFRLLKQLLPETRKMYEGIQEGTNNVLEQFDKDIFDVDFHQMLKRFRTDYTSILKIFKSQYRRDRQEIKLLSVNAGRKLNDKAVIEILSVLKGISDKKEWIAEKETLLISLFGSYYQKEFTDWNTFESGVVNFEKISGFFGVSGVHKKTQEILLAVAPPNELEIIKKQLNKVWESDFPNIISQTIFVPVEIESVQLKELRKLLESALLTMQELAATYDTIRKFCIGVVSYAELFETLSKLKRWQNIFAEIESQSESLKANFVFLFKGIDTNWDRIINSLSWMDEFKKMEEKFDLPMDFVTKVCEDTSFIKLIGQHLEMSKSDLDKIEPEVIWYFSLFDETKDLVSSELYALLNRTENCLNNLSALEEWVDFRRSREKCKEAGLFDYIEKVQTFKIRNNLIVPAFEKRFYRLWLDAVLPKFPAVNSFRSRVHEEVIREFGKLDITQLNIARSRVRERLVARLPDLSQLTHSHDEVGVLKRELNKQRRIMPLRKLFRAIPNLLLTLKPCLMMSPLSVSLFLETENYFFDIVIFDEASQVCTEDAIGAISRGAQVVIAGDSKQLPPTNFFTASISDSEFDSNDMDEDDYDDTDAYESVLEETATVLPELTLRWHYRSRHEHLIAFSNEKIYRNSLITFPSPINNKRDIGVEYIHVHDGVYDRGGKRNNIREAKEVAKIVWEHFQKYPNRTLGVVTFSEAQQQAVETTIRQLRLMNQYLEDYFREDKEEPFFVKNLENVQGDERDTIIISIGYAKDRNSIMSMNFGPLNRSGGYRRLNVAITRAKYNVKLVGSIEPTDIAIENTSSEGLKLLRSFIEFAKNGEGVLRREITVPDILSPESPFEEAVYEFISSKGYSVVTQVGCSGYRIDLAVKHPSLNGRFVLGIECDGASYHSARTARERDRLRQTVLEDNGWKIYRIWSTDWIKDPVTEGQKLCDAIEHAICTYSESDGEAVKKGEKTSEKPVTEALLPMELLVETGLENKENSDNPYNFDYYNEANIYNIRRSYDTEKYLAAVIKHVVKEEYPIHFDLLCTRITPLLGNQRASEKVRSTLTYVIRRYLRKEIESRGDFYWPVNENYVKVRIPNPNGDLRKVEHISTEEVAEAMYVVVSRSYGILRKNLLIATARVFGYKRTGVHIVKAMEAACEHLIRTDRVKEIDEKIIPINNASIS